MKKAAFILALALLASPVYAELSRFTAGKVQHAHNLQQQEKLDEAIALLARLTPARAYDESFVKRMLGVFYWQKGDTGKAIANLSFAVDSGLLQDEQGWASQRMLADILLSDGQFKRALPHYYQLSEAIPLNQQADELWFRIAQAHYQLSEWHQVLAAIKTYESFSPEADVQPLIIKLGAQLQLKQWQGALPTLKRLISLEPDRSVWWQQMAGIQLRLERPNDALDTLALARRQGVKLSQQDLKTLAQLYARRGIPERAARLYAQLESVETDPELLSTQAQYWQMAKEWDKAISVWSLAAGLDNRHRWPLAQLLLQQGHYRKALAELDKVELKGREDDIELARVRAYYRLDNLEQAMIHAKLADNIKPTTVAKSWIKYLGEMRKNAI